MPDCEVLARNIGRIPQRRSSRIPQRRSIRRPQARRRELKEMTVGIAEIDALAATAPSGAALDRDTVFGEPLLPVGKLVGADRKRNVQGPVTIVRRNGSAGHAHGFEREAAPEDEQHALAADVVSAEARVARERGELEHVLVETRRAIEIVDVERGLEHAVEPGHEGSMSCRETGPGVCGHRPRHHMLSVARASSDIRVWSQGGSQTMLTLTSPTPATLATAFSTMVGSSCADGQLGVVSVMSIVTARSSAMSIR